MRDFGKLVFCIIGCELVGITGSLFTASSISDWYAILNKPFFSPPNWIFAPVWTILYLMMGISAFLIWQKGLKKKGVRESLNLFLVQLALNFFWSIFFFGLKSPLVALICIIALWYAIYLTIKAFSKISKTASKLLIPYLLWVSFATILNLSLVILNP
ncbi:MAG TPA: TspO/MBR family protein [Patescibacteria group bacterium]|nr:TspO/MBR family protein [Patescibacteria group bacterium]